MDMFITIHKPQTDSAALRSSTSHMGIRTGGGKAGDGTDSIIILRKISGCNQFVGWKPHFEPPIS